MSSKKEPSHSPRSKNASPSPRKGRNLATTRVKKSSTSKRAVKTSAPEVRLPKNMSQRTVEKSIVIKREFDEHYRRAMYRVAYVSGLCFVLIGASFAGSTLLSDIPLSNQTAQLGDAMESTNLPQLIDADEVHTNLVTTTSEPIAVISPPKVRLIDPLPATLNTESVFRLQASDTKRIIVKVRNANLGSFILPDPIVTDRGNGEYRFVIPAHRYSPGTYQLVIIAEGENGTNPTFPSGYFRVPSALDTNIAESGADDTADLPRIRINEDTNLMDTTDSEPERTFVDPSPVDGGFTIFNREQTLTGVVTVGVNPPSGSTYLELYTRPISGGNARFIGLASSRFDRWQFVVDSRTIPNGEYNFYAQTKSGASTFTTPSLRLTVQNASVPLTNTQTREAIRDLPTEERESIVPVRTFILDTNQASVDRQSEADSLRSVSDRLVREDADSFKEFFRDFTAAKRASNESSVDEVRERLRHRRADIVAGLSDISDERRAELDQILEERIIDIEDRVTRFERIRQDRSVEPDRSFIDSDGDGISDLDERELYGTDPFNPDTNGDGIPDGVSIVRGINPLATTTNEVIRFESPKETVALDREDTLVVESVTAITSTSDEDDSLDPIRTHIRGKALPSSFVTLYIFSTPTVVTIRTDADGSFVYTFDKELEDGAHDVYVAMTDSTGRIVAQSSPFSFIKRAEAFTPVDAAEAEVVTTGSIADPGIRGYNIAIGVGVLAFGVILLMLGIGLRTKDDEIEAKTVTSENDDDKESARPVIHSSRPIEHIDAS